MKDQKSKKYRLGLGLGLGLGIPVFAAAVFGAVYGIKITSKNIIGEKGSVTFKEWLNDEGTGILNYANEGHFPAGLSSTIAVDGGNVNDIKSFMNNYLNPGIIADGLIRSKVYDGLLTVSTAFQYNLIEASLKWDGTGDKTLVEFDLLMRLRDDEEAEILEDKVTYTLQQSNGCKYGKITIENESTILAKPDEKFTCNNLDYMVIISPKEGSTIDPKYGWEIAYQTNGQDKTASIVVPYKDFDNKLDVINGVEYDLGVTINMSDTLYVGEIYSFPIITSLGEITSCNVYSSQQSVASAYYEDGNVIIVPMRPGQFDLTVKVASGKHIGVWKNENPIIVDFE